MRQQVVQIGTSGLQVSDVVNKYLKLNAGWRLTNMFGIEVQRVGGGEKQVIAVFETKDESVSGDLVEPTPGSRGSHSRA